MSFLEEKESDYVKLRFSGKKEDWPKWSTQFLALAQLKKFKRHLLGLEEIPNESEELDEDSLDNDVKKKLRARTANERAYSALTLTCSETKSFRIVYNAKTKELPSGSAALAWEKLKARFEPTSGATLTQLKREFNESQLRKGESPDDWIERLESLRSRIDQIMGGQGMSDKDLILHIISNLPEEYETIVDMAMKQLTLKMLTLDTLQEDLQLKFERLKSKKHNKSENALFTKQFKGRCGLCGKIGHKKEQCWELEKNKSKRPKNWKKSDNNKDDSDNKLKKNITCYNCNQQGHISRYCPKKNKKENGMTATDENEDNKEVEYSFCVTSSTEKEENKVNYWVGDTGASQHMKYTLDGLTDLTKTETTISVGNGTKLKSTITGTFKGTVVQKDGTEKDITLHNVAYVPSLTYNLLSITKALENGFHISNEEKIMVLRKENFVIKFDRIKKTNAGYCPGILIKLRVYYETANTAIVNHNVDYHEAHQKLGHPGHDTTRATALKLGWTLTKEEKPCESCPIGKARQKNLNREAGRKSEGPGQVFASDLSWISTQSAGGKKYWLLVVDQYTSMKWSFFLSTKDEQVEVLTTFVKNILNKFKIERWKFDNAGENVATQKAFEEQGFGIKIEYTARETPQQNGMVERAFATLYGRIRALNNHAGFEKEKREKLWPECAATATKLDNILVNNSNEKSAYEKFYGIKSPIEQHLRIFGEVGIVTKHNNKRIRSKLENWGIPCVFMGYAKDHAANVYRMLNLETNLIIITRDIKWLKKTYGEYIGLSNLQ